MGSVVAVQYVLPPAEPMQDPRAEPKYQQRQKQPMVMRTIRAKQSGGGADPDTGKNRDMSVRGTDVDGRRVTVAAADLARRKEARGDGMYTSASTPRETLDELKAGNARFWTGTAEAPNLSLIERTTLIDGQAPKVMVIGCADSRVPIEIVFDQGLGDVFVCRNAGNQCGDTVAGTVDYALNHLGIKLVVVMGSRPSCGSCCST
ncbi:carbonic anhydrase [Pavlovales sp. CCMP2436]|nr:carbonic anhydrase [Pavlovales sp. CCMP2436]